MGYLYRPKLKAPNAPADRKGPRCAHERHGREDTCPRCGARFGKVWWVKYYNNGKAIRESTETEKESEARRILKDREGRVASGQPILPRADRIQYEEAAADLRQHYTLTGSRNLEEAGDRLKHLDAFFTGSRIARIGPADVTRYVLHRQKAQSANGTINRELAILGQMLRLAYENGKLLRLPILRQLEEAPPPGRLLRAGAIRGSAPTPPDGSPGGRDHRLHLRLAHEE